MRAILIAGPTASGKSEAALAMARRQEGVIVNADSMQVYRELRILTARPTPQEEAEVPHRLFGHVPAEAPYSVGIWLGEAAAAMREAWALERVPVVVGGTGLFLRALERGLAPVPDIPGPVRARWRAALAERGAADLHAELARLSPGEAARLRPSDGQRIARALEVLEATGQPLSVHQSRAATPPLESVEVERILLMPERDELYRRCDARVRAMLEAGALDEVRSLLSLGLDPALPAMKAIGVRPLARHVEGGIGLDEAVALAQRETRNYAKRQMTWFRHQTTGWRIGG